MVLDIASEVGIVVVSMGLKVGLRSTVEVLRISIFMTDVPVNHFLVAVSSLVHDEFSKFVD